MSVDYDVAIVGYGPVGQLAAILLGRAGWNVVVVERWPASFRLPRAVHFDDEIARILQDVGIRPDTSPVIDPYDDLYEWRSASGAALLRVDWRGRGLSGWHTSNHFSQPELEDALDARVRRQPSVVVRRGVEATRVENYPDRVQLTVRSGDLSERIAARYVIACDGANSFVRDQVGITTHDLGFFYEWLIIDVVPSSPMTFSPSAWQLCDPARPTTVTPSGPGRRRWEFMMLPGEEPQEMDSLATAVRLLKPWGVNESNATIERHTTYRFQARWAEQWQEGRVLLAGDAAHQMPPFAGQGMCSGFRDVSNLAWKLDRVLSGQSAAPILSTYGTERAPHVHDLVEYSMMLGRIICVTDPAEAAKRDAEMVAAGEQAVPPPRPRLGPGILDAADPRAGRPSAQGRVRLGGSEGLADDVLGGGWRLISWSPLDLPRSSSTLPLAVWPMSTDPSSAGVIDVDGSYARWREALTGSGQPLPAAVLVRPDHYVHSVVSDPADLPALLTAVEGQVEGHV